MFMGSSVFRCSPFSTIVLGAQTSYVLKCLIGRIWDCDVIAAECLQSSQASVP